MLLLMDCTKCTKIILGLFFSIYFGSSLVICDEDIPFCKESLKELKKDLKDWQERCLNITLEYSRDIDTPCCNAEKKYIQNRRKMHRKLCFYKGKHFIYIYIYLYLHYLQHERPCCIGRYKLEPKARVCMSDTTRTRML